MTVKGLVLSGLLFACALSAQAETTKQPNQELNIDQKGQMTMTPSAQPSVMPVPPPADPNQREIDSKTASGSEQKTIIDQGGNLKMVSPPKSDTAPDSATMQDMPAVKQ